MSRVIDEYPQKKRVRKKSFKEHVGEALTTGKHTCSKKHRCAVMAGALAVADEDKKPIGLADGFFFTRGGAINGAIVYYARRAQYAVVHYCPFCGGQLRARPLIEGSPRKLKKPR